MGLKINVFLSMEEEISIGEDGEVEDECDAGEFLCGGLSFWVICVNFSWNGLTVWKCFRLEIHNCGSDYAKSYIKNWNFYIGAWVSGWFVWMHLFLEEKIVWI